MAVAAFVAPWALPAIGGLLGGGAAAFLGTTAGTVLGTSLLTGAGSWLGSELGETYWDATNPSPATQLGVDVPKGLFFQGKRNVLEHGITDISESLGDAWDDLLEGMDDAQLAGAVTTFATNILNPMGWLGGPPVPGAGTAGGVDVTGWNDYTTFLGHK